MKNLYNRTISESNKYKSAEDAVIDHLKMAHSHFFEESGGRDLNGILSDIEKIILKVKPKL